MDLTDGLKWYLVFLFSTTLHEAAHAWTAWQLGDDTAYRGGQVSLDPTPHLKREPIGMLVVPLLSFLLGGWMIGWASTPYRIEWALAQPRRAGLMALSGPLANLTLILLSGLAMILGVKLEYFEASTNPFGMHIVNGIDGLPFFFATILSITFTLNTLLTLFNLLPFPPLDGSSILLLLLPKSLGQKYFIAIHHPNLSWIGLFISWKVSGWFLPIVQAETLQWLYRFIP